MSERDMEPIVSRVIRLNQLVLGRVKNNQLDYHAVSRDGLLDALFALYTECNTPHLKKDPNVSAFIEKFHNLIPKLQSLRVNITDFEIKKIIGRGHFGEVQVVREKSTGDVYAMKVLHKAETLAQQCVAFYEEERDIMAKATSPWITKLQYAFQDSQNLYLIMEFHAGGDMLSLLEKCNILTEEMAQFYIAELVLAIHSVHAMGYVHRDIKPDNILIDITGHIKLADFGSSAKLNSSQIVVSKMPVGTPDYIAPEVLVSINKEPSETSGYSVECDWWSLGIVAYEMLYGVTPFANEKLLVVYNNIMNFKESLSFPEESAENSEEFLDLIKRLLSEANLRMGYAELIDHPLFTDIDWNNIRQTVPPFVPIVSGQDDTSNFDEFEHDVRPLISDLGSKPEFSGRNLPFVGFSYTTAVGSTTERLSSLDSSLNSPTQIEMEGGVSKRKGVNEMQKTIMELLTSEENLREENRKLTESLVRRERKLDKYENEISRLEKEITMLQFNKKELMRLLELEHEDRILTEKKASQILKCMKKKKNRSLTPNIIMECNEDSDEKCEIKISDQLDEAFVDLDTVGAAHGSYSRLLERAKSLSPHCSKNNVGKLPQEYANLEKKNKTLQDELKKCKEEREKVMAAMKLYHDDHTDLEQELKQVGKERDEAQMKVNELKKRITVLELQVYDYENDGKSEDSTSQINDLIHDIQKDVDIKNDTIFDLKKQLIHMREKQFEYDKQIEKHRKEYEKIVDSKNHLENQLKQEFEKGISHSVQIADLKKTIETLRKDIFQKDAQLTEVKQQGLHSAESAAKFKRRKDAQDLDHLHLTQRVAELEKNIETLKKTLETKEFEICMLQKKANSTNDTFSTANTSLYHTAEVSSSSDSLDSKTVLHIPENMSLNAINHAEQKLNQKISQLRDENDQLTNRIADLEKKINSLAKNENVDEIKTKLLKQLKEKEGMLSDVKLDLRIITREKKDADEIVSFLRNTNRTLKEKLAEAEKSLIEKNKLETELKDKIDILEKEVSWKKRDIDEKIKMYETQKDINKVFVKTQDQIQQMTEEKEKLKTDSSTKDSEKSQMALKLEKVEKELQAKSQECSRMEKINGALRSACTDLEEQLEDFEDIVKTCESELKINASEISKFKQQIISLEGDLKRVSSEYGKEKKAREEFEKQIGELEEDLESQQAIHETEMHSLQEFIDHQKNIISSLEEQVTQMEQQCTTYNQDVNSYERKISSLEDELIQLKEETAKHITQISSLKSSNLSLTQELEQMIENQKDAEGVIDQLTNNLETTDATFNHERVKFQEQLCQQSKLIDFLRAKTEGSDKRKKTLNLPRIFGKKDNSLSTFPSQRNEIDGLEKEKTKCRRLQDQLSQARAEIMSLRNQVSLNVAKTPIMERNKSSFPVSPMSRAMHLALTSSPTVSNDLESSLVSREVSTKVRKMQGMTHRIPHRFNDIICMRSAKCVACLDSIHFGRRAVKCQECTASCHPKCAWSLPKTCGLPSEFFQHFEDSVHKNASSQISSDEQTESEPKGWIKIPKANKQGWEQRYLRIIGSSLYFFTNADDENILNAVDSMNFAVNNGDIIIISAVSATELTSVAKSDLPYVLKVEFRPFTTCWPPKTLYIMTTSFADKQQWVMILESLADKYKVELPENPENKLSASQVLKLKGEMCLDILCTFVLNDNILLLGAVEGLFVVSLSSPYSGTLKYKIEGIDGVYQIACMDSINKVIIISGPQRNLGTIQSDSLRSWIYNGNLPPIAMDLINGINGCHLFAVQEENSNSPFLCSATEQGVALFQWDDSLNAFNLRQTTETQEPCSCIHFTKNSVILGCDKFFEVDLKTYEVQEFLDRADSSLACVIYGVAQFQSFPISIFRVAPDDEEEEYLVCFHELGVFVDGFGQRTRAEDMKWSRLPLAFAFQSPYLFMTHFNSVEVIEILPRESSSSENGVRGVIKIANPQYLGAAPSIGAIYISSSQNNLVEILCIEGDSAKPKSMISDIDESSSPQITESSFPEESSPGSQTTNRESKESDGDGSNFSFTNSLLQSLESGDNFSDSSTDNAH